MIHQNAPRGVFTVGKAVASGLRHGCVRISAIDSFYTEKGMRESQTDFVYLVGKVFQAA